MMFSDLSARERIVKARSQMVTNPRLAFFGTLALGLKVQETHAIETAAVDGRSFYYNPAWILTLREPEVLAVWVHEVWHLARLHHVRRAGRDMADWNEACDLTINPDLLREGFALPAEGLQSREFEGQGAESVYAELQRRKPKGGGGQQGPSKPEGGDSQSGASGQATGGDGAPSAPGRAGNAMPDGKPCPLGDGPGTAGNGGPSNAPDPGKMGGVIDAPADQGTIEEQAAEMESRVRQAISVARAANAGELPGFLARVVDELNASRVNWRDALAEFIDDSAERMTCWNRPNKRFLGGAFILPGSTADSVGDVGVVVDTSGSVDDSTLAAFQSEVQGILDSGRVERVHVVYCDSKVQASAVYERGELVTLECLGGGGTRFDVGLAALPEWVSAAVYLTDLHSKHWGAPPEFPVLWAVLGPRRAAPFGRVLPIDPHA
jgi:predicted metal-dependent peptidase